MGKYIYIRDNFSPNNYQRIFSDLLLAETLFPDMKVTNHDSPSGISITWDAPRDQVIHQLTHYRVTYEIVSEAGQPVKNASMFSVNVSANSKQLSLDGLKTYTTYKIKVESVSLDGKVHNNKILLAGRLSGSLVSFYFPFYFFSGAHALVSELHLINAMNKLRAKGQVNWFIVIPFY